jgi:hypothetical protein
MNFPVWIMDEVRFCSLSVADLFILHPYFKGGEVWIATMISVRSTV